MKILFVNNGPVKIHVLENGAPSSKVPSLFVISGIWEPAERAIPLLSRISSHVVALSFRGRGSLRYSKKPFIQVSLIRSNLLL